MKFKKSIISAICILSIISISIFPSYATKLKALKYNHNKGTYLYLINLVFNHKIKFVDGKKKFVRHCDRRFFPKKLSLYLPFYFAEYRNKTSK